MQKTVVLIAFPFVLALAGDRAQIRITLQEEFYELAGSVTALGKHTEILLPGVAVCLFRGDKIADSTRLNSAGEFDFTGLAAGEYDLAFWGNLFFPKKICGIEVDSAGKIYPSVELQILEEKYPDSTWRPGRYLYVTFKSDLTEEEIIRRLDWDYHLQILPFNNNSRLRPLLRFNGEKLFRATAILDYDQEELVLANKLVLDPYVYSVEPDLLLPFPPAVKTNQKPGARKR